MADIFLSYASENKPQAERIAHGLETSGLTVWWDERLLAGTTYDEVITENLDNAGCIVVLWSRYSTQSDWVKDEANEGAKRKVLVPVLIEDVNIPLGFRRIQTARLIGWNGTPAEPPFEDLRNAIFSILGKSSAKQTAPDSETVARSTPKYPIKQRPSWLAIALVLMIDAVVGYQVGVFIENFSLGPPGAYALVTWIGFPVAAYILWLHRRRRS